MFTFIPKPVTISHIHSYSFSAHTTASHSNILLLSKKQNHTALSCIEANKESRRVNLIWTIRDASMPVFFLENAKLDGRGLNN